MIIAYTEYDAVTSRLSDTAQRLVEAAGERVTLVLGNPAPAGIRDALTASPEPLFFFGHGRREPPALLGRDREPAIDGNSVGLIGGRLVFAAACHSLGVAPAEGDYTVIGFAEALRVCNRAPYIDPQHECLMAGPLALLAGEPAESAARAMQTAFRETARELQANASFEASLIAVQVFMHNGSAAGFRGNGARRV